MTKQNAWNRRKSRNGQRKQKKEERYKVHETNCQRMDRKKRREGRTNDNQVPQRCATKGMVHEKRPGGIADTHHRQIGTRRRDGDKWETDSRPGEIVLLDVEEKTQCINPISQNQEDNEKWRNTMGEKVIWQAILNRNGG